ncbi:iron-sulfur cluster repair di-iron protein [Cytobacillus gottheilii]|uniref:iron-sulfur cluster repair di-iron protein n=1 Tax=Cytobacillus gottheilii TaxID=859144 RepID=UPI0009BA2A85|nr:iron-sulfur cluster repair di-iron protein [Cytobacillus gottheilii]
MIVLNEESIVKEIVNEYPRTSDIFKRYQIDFCCGGNNSLLHAVENKNISLQQLMDELHDSVQNEQSKQDHPDIWTNSSSEQLIHHIQEYYHAELKEELPALSPYVTKVSRVHGERKPELIRVYELFYALKKELLEHTEKEEQEVFPLLIQMDHMQEESRDQLQSLIDEHKEVGQLLAELRSVTSNYTPPLDACGTYRLVYKRLERLEEQTFMHIHLENNILFPRYS